MASKNGRFLSEGLTTEAPRNTEDTLLGGTSAGDSGESLPVHNESSDSGLEPRGVHAPSGSDRAGNDVSAEFARKLLAPTIPDHGCPGDPLWTQYKRLGDMLFRGTWNGIMPRKPAMLTIVVRPTGLQFTLRMPTEGKQVRDNVSYFADLLPRLEQCLQEMLGDWSDLTNGPGATYKREQRKKLLAKSDSPI